MLLSASALLRGPGFKMHGQWVPDSFTWLESDTDASVLKWAASEDRAARAQLEAVPELPALEARLAELLDTDTTTAPRRYGKRSFFARTKKGEEKPRYFFQADGGPEVLLLDSAKMNGSISVVAPSWDGLKVVYRHHPAYNDAAHLVVLDISNPEKFKELANLPGARYAYPSWTPDNSGFFYTHLPPKPADLPEAAWPGLQTLVHFVIGAHEEPVVVTPPSHDPMEFVSGAATRDGRFLLRSRREGWDATRLDVMKLPPARADGTRDFSAKPTWELLLNQGNADAVHHNGTFFIYHSDGGCPKGQVLVLAEDAVGKQEPAVLVPESSEDVLDSVQLLGGVLVLQYLHDLRPYVQIHALDGRRLRSFGLPDGAEAFVAAPEGGPCRLLPQEGGRGLGVISAFSGDPAEKRAYFAVQSPLHAPAILSLDLPDGAPSLWFQQQPPKTSAKVVAEQHFAPSTGGVRVPMLVLRPEGAEPRRTILTAYGGFGVTLYPRYQSLALAWLEHDGAFAIANLRGGGEYGFQWHEAGMRLQKQNVFDDFANAAQHLVDQKVTLPELLLCEGGSNGGLLTGAAVTQVPERFGAVVVRVPLLDMIKFPDFDSGATWIPEYGDPANTTEFAALLKYSPYHNVAERQERPYPPVLLMSTAKDDRVSPMHARKFAARLHAAGQPALLRVEEGGHGGVSARTAFAKSEAQIMAFGLLHLHARQQHGHLRSFGSNATAA